MRKKKCAQHALEGGGPGTRTLDKVHWQHAARRSSGCFFLPEVVHVDAVWLCSLFRDSPCCREQVVGILSRHIQTDMRAACFVGWLQRDSALLCWAADQGDGLAQGLLYLNSQTRETWMERAAASGDPRGLFWRAESVKSANIDLAMKLWRQAADAGLVCAYMSLGVRLSLTNEERYKILVKAFLRARIIIVSTVWKSFWER